MRAEDFGAPLTLVEGEDGLWSPPMAAPACEPRDWRSLYEQAYARAEKGRARADTAQARAEQLRRAEVDSRSRAGSLKCQLDTCRHKLKAGAEQTKEVRRASKDALFFQAEVARLETLLSQAGVESSKRTTIVSLRMEVARLRTALQASQARTERLEGQLAKLRATGTVLSKALYGRKSEQQEKPRSGRKRGQQPGAVGHGRTRRPGLEERTEEHNPPADARLCSCCAKPYVANGERSSTVIEIEVKPHTRRIVRPRWRRSCECASSPVEVSAPPVARLFPNTPYGVSFWARFVFEHCACLRPLHRVAAWLCAQGLSVSPGTLANTHEALRDAVRASGRGDPRAPERGGVAPCRRDHLARAGASRGGSVEPGLAVDLGQQRRGLLPHRPEPQCRGGAQAVRRGHARYGHRLRPLQRLQEAGAPSRGTGDPCMVLEICCGRDYVAERQHPYVRREKPPNLRNIFF